MADLRDLLHEAAPTPPEFDEAALRRTVAKRNARRRASLAAGAVAIGVTTSDHSDRHTLIVSPSSTTPQTTAPSVPPVADDVQWHALPRAPIAARAGAASVWAGSAFVVWGGRDASFRALSDGAWYDPRAQVWHSMRASPLGPAASDAFFLGVPVADEAVIVSGTKAAAYTPADDTWRVLPDVPLAKVDSSALTMPGAPQWVVVSGKDHDGQDALAWLDTAHDSSWHTVASRGYTRAVLLANGHVAYWYSNDHGVEIDLASGAQHTIPATFKAQYPASYPFDPGEVAGSLVISPLAAVSWNATTGAYEDLSYRSIGMAGANATGYCSGAWAWTGQVLLTWGGSECQGDSYIDAGAEYDPSTGTVRPLPQFLSGRTGMAFAWTGTELLVWGGQTDSNGQVIADGASLAVSTRAQAEPSAACRIADLAFDYRNGGAGMGSTSAAFRFGTSVRDRARSAVRSSSPARTPRETSLRTP